MEIVPTRILTSRRQEGQRKAETDLEEVLEAEPAPEAALAEERLRLEAIRDSGRPSQYKNLLPLIIRREIG